MQFKEFLQTHATDKLRFMINCEPELATKFNKGFCGGNYNRFGWFAWANPTFCSQKLYSSLNVAVGKNGLTAREATTMSVLPSMENGEKAMYFNMCDVLKQMFANPGRVLFIVLSLDLTSLVYSTVFVPMVLGFGMLLIYGFREAQRRIPF